MRDVRDHASRSRVQGWTLRPDARPLEAGRELYQETRAGDVSSVCGDPVTRPRWDIPSKVQTTDPVPPTREKKASRGSGPAHGHGRGVTLEKRASHPRNLPPRVPEVLAQSSALPPRGQQARKEPPPNAGPTLPLRKRGPALTCASQALRRCPGAARGLTASGPGRPCQGPRFILTPFHCAPRGSGVDADLKDAFPNGMSSAKEARAREQRERRVGSAGGTPTSPEGRGPCPTPPLCTHCAEAASAPGDPTCYLSLPGLVEA